VYELRVAFPQIINNRDGLMPTPYLNRFVLVLIMSVLTACTSLASYTQAGDDIFSASTPAGGTNGNVGEEIALRALALVGKPYRYGGADLQGFDCSGLVFYIHDTLGMIVPRTAADQQRAAISVDRSALQPGDLLFFKTTTTRQDFACGCVCGRKPICARTTVRKADRIAHTG